MALVGHFSKQRKLVPLNVRDATVLNILLNRTVRYPRFNLHFEIVLFSVLYKFYVTSFDVIELAPSELQSSP